MNNKPPLDRDRLAERMRELGAQEHELYYYLKEELEQDIPVLPGLVLAQAVNAVRIRRGNDEWIDATTQELERLETEYNPWCGADPELLEAYRDFQQSGMSPQSLTAIAHAVQTNLLNTLVKLLDDGTAEGEFEDICWGLFEADAEGRATRKFTSLARYLCDEEDE